MKTRITLAFLMLFAFICLLPSFCFALDYSADMVSYVDQKPQMTGKLYISGKKARVEMASGMVAITRPDKSVVWILMPEQKTYMERPIKPEDMATAKKMKGEVKRTYLGEESVEGRVAKKYRIEYDYEGRTGVLYSWIDKGLQVPVKVSDEKGKWMVIYKDIKTGSQPDSLFEMPEGYRKMPAFGFSSGLFQGKSGASNGHASKGGKQKPKTTEESSKQQNKVTLPGGIKVHKFW